MNLNTTISFLPIKARPINCVASLKTAESQQWEPGGNEVTDKVCYSNAHLLNGRTLILDTDHWWRGHLDWWLFNQVRLLIEWQSRIPFKVHNSSTPREGLPGSSQPASENKSFVSPPPPLLLLLLLMTPESSSSACSTCSLSGADGRSKERGL